MLLKRFSLFSALLLCSPAFSQFSGNALDFDGTDDMVIVNKAPALFDDLASNDFTFEAWINTKKANFSRIFFAQSSSENFAAVSTGDANGIYFYVVIDGTTHSFTTNDKMPLNEWTHVVARWTSATLTPEVFFNGELQEGHDGGVSTTGTSGLMVLGSRPDGFQYYNGAIDEARLWSEARTDSEIKSNYKKNITGEHANLIMNYDFNQGIGGAKNSDVTILHDKSGNGNEGTLTNFTLDGKRSNWIGDGKVILTSDTPLAAIGQKANASVCYGGTLTFPDGTTQTNIILPFTQTSKISGVESDTIILTSVFVNPIDTVREFVSVGMNESIIFSDGTIEKNITSTIVHSNKLISPAGCQYVIVSTVSVNPIVETPLLASETPIETATRSDETELSPNENPDPDNCIVILSDGPNENNGQQDFDVYPNPTTDFIFILTDAATTATIEVIDVAGAVVMRSQFTGTNAVLDFSELAAGAYFVAIDTPEGREVRKVWKQ